MEYYLGIDTSNYTTSVALISQDGTILQRKKLLPVKSGERGLRQSDAVFHHTKQLPNLIEDILSSVDGRPLAIGVSSTPTTAKGSYMPCFLVGETVARSMSAILKVPLYKTSHQVGHVLAGIVSNECFELLDSKFLAFHVSGGTTDCLLCTPNANTLIDISKVATSLDLKGGQAVDRIGISLGLDFPCGMELEKLALQSIKTFKINPPIKEGNCCLSGIENICNKMLSQGELPRDVALYCLEYIYSSIRDMSKYALKKFGNVPILYVGGVMSNSIIRKKLSNEFECYFAQPQLSCDNAVGVSFYAMNRYVKAH
ncbi:MAG: peptidase M22 [Ruminococcus sp.]|nr:peptidase M22 [Ruminococcus sp.]